MVLVDSVAIVRGTFLGYCCFAAVGGCLLVCCWFVMLFVLDFWCCGYWLLLV